MLEDPHEALEQLDPLHVQLDTGHFQFLLKKNSGTGQLLLTLVSHLSR